MDQLGVACGEPPASFKSVCPCTGAGVTELLPGLVTMVRPGKVARFVAKPSTGDTFALPAGDPLTVGASLRIFDVGATAGDNTYALPAGTPSLGWKGFGSPDGSKGYRYRGAGTPTDPCKLVIIREKVIKGLCVGSAITLSPPFDGEVGVILTIGTIDRYCAQFGGDEAQNDATRTKRKYAPAPGACPDGGSPGGAFLDGTALVL
jgi:hypothetical protein